MCRADLLLLDEPTNHLDLDAALWLEHWLSHREGTTLIISHDRDFLDQVVTDVIHLENGRGRSYKGNYSSFERQRIENMAREQAMAEKQQKRVAEIQSFVNRFKAKATKARQAQSRLKELERMELIAPAHADSPYQFSFPNPAKVSNPLLHIEDGILGYDTAVILKDVKVTLQPGARIGLLGKNGAGKSTLVRTIAQELKMISGEYQRGKHAHVGYFAQHTMESLNLDKSPLVLMAEINRPTTDQISRNYLGGWGFPGSMCVDPCGTLSGGEKARLALALIAWQQPGVLLLDEPTNHLDLEMRHALTIALQSYEGALVVVSHDRYLLENTVDELLLVGEGTVQPYDGTLDEYRSWLLSKDATDASNTSAKDENNRSAKRRDSAQKREQTKPLRRAIRDIEKKMAALEPKLKAINDQLADTDTYQKLGREAVSELLIEHNKHQQRLDGLEEEWLAASEALDAAMED